MNCNSQTPISKRQRSTKRQASNESDASVNGWDSPDLLKSIVLREEPPVNVRHPFDLEERTAKFGEAIIRFAKIIPQNAVNNRLISQIVGAGTSVGANYCEADESVSKKDFRNTISRCVKEAKETKFFLRMIATAEPQRADEARALFREAKELHLIFCSIRRK